MNDFLDLPLVSLSPERLSAFSPELIGKLSAFQISTLTELQLTALKTEQVAVLSSVQVLGLLPEQVAALTSEQVGALSLGAVRALAPGQLGAMWGGQLEGLTPQQLAVLTAAQIGSLKPYAIEGLREGVALLSSGQMAGLMNLEGIGPDALALISTGALRGWTPQAVGTLRGEQLGMMSPVQIAALTSVQVAALSTDGVGSLGAEVLMAFGSQQLRALGSGQIAALGSDAISGLEPADFALFTSAQVRGLGGVIPTFSEGEQPQGSGFGDFSQLTAITVQQLQAVKPEALRGLRPEVLAELNTDQAQGLSSAQVGALSGEQLARLMPESVRALDLEDVAALTSAQIAAAGISASFEAFTPDQVAALKVQAVAGLRPEVIGRLRSDAIEALTTGQFVAMTTGQIAALGGKGEPMSENPSFGSGNPSEGGQPAMVLGSLAGWETRDIAVLNSAQVAALRPEQVRSLNAEQVGAISPLAIRGLSVGVIGSFVSEQVAALTAAQVAGFSTAQIAAITGDQMSALTTSQVSGWSSAQKKAFVSPIVLDLNGNGIETIHTLSGVDFDINNDGVIERTGWVGRNDGLLVRDINDDALINNGGELFGEGTILANGRHAANGYVALGMMDSNHDGVINRFDQDFVSLKIWRDLNGNGVSDAGELKSLADYKINELSLNAHASSQMDNGNLVGLMGSYTTDDGKLHTMGDVWFATDRAGNHTFDLDGLIEKVTAASTEKVRLSSGGSPGHRDVRLEDVLSSGTGGLAELAVSHLMSIDGHVGDSVSLVGDGWALQGDVATGADHYSVYVNHNAQVMINDRVQVHWEGLL